MQKAKIYAFLDSAILSLLFIFMICEHQVRLTAVKNISLYTALFLAIAMLLVRREHALKNIKFNFNLSKRIVTPTILFVAYALFISAFAYDRSLGSFGSAFSEFGRGAAFLFIIYIWCDGSAKKAQILFYSFIAALFFITIYYSQMLFVDLANFKSEDHSIGRIIKRSYADYVDRFMIFLLIGFVLFKSGFMKFCLALLFLLAIAMEILSGVRGSWGVQIVCFLLFFIALYLGGYDKFLRDNLKKFLALGVLCIAIFAALALSSTMVSYKIYQGLDSSGRYLILKERLPVFLRSERAWLGLGHGKEQYDEFLRDQADLGAHFSMMQTRQDGKRYWFNDEPFFIGNFYYYGVFGTLMLGLMFAELLGGSFLGFLRTRNLMFAAIFISVLGYFGVRGLFESINLRILYMFYMIGFFVVISSFCAKNGELKV